MFKLRVLRPLAVGLAASLAVTPVLAATINAFARDSNGKGVGGVLMTLQDANGAQAAQQTTDARGRATFENPRSRLAAPEALPPAPRAENSV